MIEHIDGSRATRRTHKAAGAFLIWLALGALVLDFLAPAPGSAEGVRLLDGVSLMSVSVRGGLSGHSPIGKIELEDFHQYDIMAMARLPWEWYSDSGWGVGTRLSVSAGAITAAGDTGLVTTLVPGFSFGPKHGRYSLDIGGGIALLSQHKFGTQDMGGAFQFTWNLALRTQVYGPIGLGYDFQHYSDATMYGDNGRGVDIHLFELTYRF
jgi:Lipid A 3-O-deacylase (PagL)